MLSTHARAQAVRLSTKLWRDRAVVESKTRIIAKATPHPVQRALLYQVNKTANYINELAREFNTMRLKNKISL